MADAPKEATPFLLTWDAATGVVRCTWPPGSVCTQEDARRSTEALHSMGHGGAPLLVDMREMAKLERGAREHYKLDKGGVSAMALLVRSPVTRMLANFFMSVDPDSTPTRMFSDEGSAVAWLTSRRSA